MTKLIAKERFFYAGCNVEAGAEFEAEAQDVALLTNSVSPRARIPDAPREMQSRSLLPIADGEQGQQTARTKRTYNRRDMRARE